MTEQPVGGTQDEERQDVRDAMATYAAEGQADDETGGDAAAGARQPTGASAEGDREPHGPA